MSNGKFFTGLPPGMMNKQTTTNRQRTNFFWPNESDFESAHESKLKKYLTRNNSVNSHGNTTPNCEPDELFKKQLTSSIQFYDFVDKNDYQRRSPSNKKKILNVAKDEVTENTVDFKAKNAEIFCSKIKFYDFTDDLEKSSKTDKNKKKDVEQNINNTPSVWEKTFKEDDGVLKKFNNFTNVSYKSKLVNKEKQNLPDIKNLEIKTGLPCAEINEQSKLIDKDYGDVTETHKNINKYIKNQNKKSDLQDITSNTTRSLNKISNDLEEQHKKDSCIENFDSPNTINYFDNQRHLKSSFSLKDIEPKNTSSSSKKKIRSTACTRVTVGLPD